VDRTRSPGRQQASPPLELSVAPRPNLKGDRAVIEYDEFSMFHENAEEFGIRYQPPQVRRVQVQVDDDRHLSALIWGTGDPELVFLHGGAQNAHTWDTVALALGRPLLAIDLPGHGHSGPGRNGSLDVRRNATDVARVVEQLAPRAQGVVGMSLGGLTALALWDDAPPLVRSIVLVDITPGVNQEKSSQIGAFVNGPETFDSFQEILDRTIRFNPTRSEASLRRGVLHNAVQREDGKWVWRYARLADQEPAGGPPDFTALWGVVSRVSVPLLLVRGMLPQSVVSDDDEAELLRRLPSARVVHVPDAGHSVQGDAPVTLAAAIDDFLIESL
jgi:pimeloyl-ACP methyl ester carboxylesterase